MDEPPLGTVRNLLLAADMAHVWVMHRYRETHIGHYHTNGLNVAVISGQLA